MCQIGQAQHLWSYSELVLPASAFRFAGHAAAFTTQKADRNEREQCKSTIVCNNCTLSRQAWSPVCTAWSLLPERDSKVFYNTLDDANKFGTIGLTHGLQRNWRGKEPERHCTRWHITLHATSHCILKSSPNIWHWTRTVHWVATHRTSWRRIAGKQKPKKWPTCPESKHGLLGTPTSQDTTDTHNLYWKTKNVQSTTTDVAIDVDLIEWNASSIWWFWVTAVWNHITPWFTQWLDN